MARLVAFAFVGTAVASTAATRLPNLIFLLTDDQDVEMGSLDYMPKLQKYIGDEGATFDQMYVAVPVCCPSRSVLLSGQYQHNNGVIGNFIQTNCSSPAWQQGPEKRSVATYLQKAGYATSFAGKYLNDYGSQEAGGVAHIPPGWTNWQGLVGNSIYYDYTLSNNGKAEKHADDYAEDYLPDLILNRTLHFIEEHAGKSPIFAVLSTPSVHDPTDSAPQYADLHEGVRAPRPLSFGAEVADAHWFQKAQAVYGLDDNSKAYIDLKYRRRLQALASVDDMVETLVERLRLKGELENTYFMYSSDNGYHLGHFGVVYDKRQPWRTDVHLPLLIRGPGIPKGVHTEALVSMPDLSATLMDMAGLAVPGHFDGASVLPHVDAERRRPSGASAADGRWMALIEYHGEGNGGGPEEACPKTHGDPSLFCYGADSFARPPQWHGRPVCACQDSLNNTYNCLLARGGSQGISGAPGVSSNFRYCEFADELGTVEYIDFDKDPHELVNLAPKMSASLRTALSQRLARAVACRGYEDCSKALSEPLTISDDEEVQTAASTPEVLSVI